MVIMSNTIQPGMYLDNIDNRSDNRSIGSRSSFNRNEIPAKNDKDMTLRKITTKSTSNNNKTTTDVEGWTTTSPGKKKPKNSNSTVASTESIITTIDGNFDSIEAGTSNRIYVTSPGRKNKCNIPDDSRQQTELEFIPTIMAVKRKEKVKDKEQDNGEDNDTSKTNDQDNGNTMEDNREGKDDNKEDKNKTNSKNDSSSNDSNNRGQGGRGERGGGRKGRGGRGGIERNLIPKTEWETYNFSISFNPKTMNNKDPDTEFQALLSEMMKKSPGITFHATNEDMFPKPKSFSNIQGYPQTEAAFKDFFEVYENKGMTIYKIFIQATMHYNELDLRNSLLNYLRSNNLWMSSDLISENVDEMIGYINYGHDKMVWRPECEKKINNGINALIQSGSIPQALRLKIDGLKKDIKIRVAAGTFRGGPRNDPVMCEGLLLRTTKAQARASMELLGLLDDNVLGEFYSIIPKGTDKEIGPQLYGDLLRMNNDMLNTLRAITVVNWPEELFLELYNPALDVPGTVALRVDTLLMNAWKCVAIERTTETETRGKYLLLFQEEDMEKAKALISNLIDDFGRESNSNCAKIALEKFNQFPEFDSIQRVSQSVQAKASKLKEMLQNAAAQRTSKTPKQIQQPRFQFHVAKQLQKQLHLPTQKSYSNIAQSSAQKKHLTIVQPAPSTAQPTTPQQQPQQATHAEQTRMTEADNTAQQDQTSNENGLRVRTSMNLMTQDTRTIATNHSGLSDQQTMTTMMTQITQQFQEMERDRITREDKQEAKRQERESKIEERRVEAQRDMYSFMKSMMMMTQNQNSENKQRKEANPNPIPDELTTGETEQTSALTSSITTTKSLTTPTGKRASALLSNTNEETNMTDIGTEAEDTETIETMSTKRNKSVSVSAKDTEDGQADDMMEDGEENTEKRGENSSSFTDGFNNQQFQPKAIIAPGTGATQQ